MPHPLRGLAGLAGLAAQPRASALRVRSLSNR